MNSNLPGLDNNSFDRLVDGELSGDEYRLLLTALEDEPGGWRRCALAFLEAQALRRDLGHCCIQPGGDERPRASIVAVVSPETPRHGNYWLLPLTAAASFALAFILGMLAARGSATTYAPQVVAHNSEPTISQSDMAQSAAAPAPAPATPASYTQPIGRARLELQTGQASFKQTVDVPVYLAGMETEQLWATAAPALSERVIEALESRGHQVEYEQRLLPLSLGDGRQVVFPIEEYQITPVSLPSY